MTKFRALTLTFLSLMILCGNVLAQSKLVACKGDVQLEGNADERGSSEYNLALGQRREWSNCNNADPAGYQAIRTSELANQKTQGDIDKQREEFMSKMSRDLSRRPSDANVTAWFEDSMGSHLFKPQEKVAITNEYGRIMAIPAGEERAAYLRSKGQSASEAKPNVIQKDVGDFGDIKYPNGNRYVGRFVNGHFQMGTYIQSTGEIYTGRYKDDAYSGLGTYSFPSGEMYIGQWKNDEFTGQGLHVAAGKKIEMIKVINACDARNIEDFPDVADCIKRSYQRVGTAPSSQAIKNFYLLLDGVMEDFNKGNYGLAKAKAEIIKAWQSTIDASNKRNEDSSAGGGGIDSFTRNQMYQDCLQRAAMDFRICIP